MLFFRNFFSQNVSWNGNTASNKQHTIYINIFINAYMHPDRRKLRLKSFAEKHSVHISKLTVTMLALVTNSATFLLFIYYLLKAKPSNAESLCRLLALKTISNKLHDITFFKEVSPLHTVYCSARKFEQKLEFIICYIMYPRYKYFLYCPVL